MAVTMTPTRLATVLLTTSPAVIYTAPSDGSVRIMGASIVNNSGAEASCTIWGPEGGSPSDANLLCKDLAVAGGGTPRDVPCLLRLDIEAGWTLYAQADTDAVLTLTLSGTLFTES